MEALIGEKLSKLREYLAYLRQLGEISPEAFSSDFRSRGAAERYLHLSIESVIDIGSEIISCLQLRRPGRYADIPEILAEAGIIPEELSSEVARMIGFRNLLVHDYARINVNLEHGFLRRRLGDFEAYMKCIVEWLGRHPSSAGE